MEQFLKGLGVAVLFTIAIVYGVFAYGFLLFKVYGWFMPIAFPHTYYPVLTLPGAVAIRFIYSTINSVYQDTNKLSLEGKEIERKTNWPALVILPWVSLFIAWLFTFIL